MKVKAIPSRRGLYFTERCDLNYCERFGVDWPNDFKFVITPPQLPTEVMEMILEMLLYNYMRCGAFALALELATLFSPDFTRKIYSFFFGGCVQHVERRRLSNTFMLIMGIQQDILGGENVSDVTFCTFKLEFLHNHFYLPWELVISEINEIETKIQFQFEVVEIAQPRDWQNSPFFHGFSCGATVGDILWLEGVFDEECMFDCKRALNPIITLYIPPNRMFDWRQKLIRDHPAWRGFNKMLRYVFGANVGIFYAMRRGNDHPFFQNEHFMLAEAEK
jgi:hypothetical protein